MKDYHKILGINKNASQDDIKLAYKKLAMRYHPDRNPNDPKAEEKFKDIKEAYDFLTNKNMPGGAGKGNFNFSDFSTSESSLDDIFNIIFKKSYKKDIKTIFVLEIDLEFAVYGCQVNIKIPYKGICINCLGKGTKPGTDLKICLKCRGSGVHTVMQGIFNFKQNCFKCNGRGYIAENCNNCEGTGKTDKLFFCNVIVEKYSDNGSPIFFNKFMTSISDFNIKDALISLKIKPHPFYLRKNLKNGDLESTIFIDFLKAVIGGILKVLTLYGFTVLKIFKYTQNNSLYILNGFGLNFKNSFGDYHLNILIEIPAHINFYQ